MRVNWTDSKAVAQQTPKPALQRLFEINASGDGCDTVLINEPPLTNRKSEAADLCSWRILGRVHSPNN